MRSVFDAFVRHEGTVLPAETLEVPLPVGYNGWTAMGPMGQTQVTDHLMLVFQSNPNALIQITPRLTSASILYRPLRNLGRLFATALLSGDVGIYDMEDDPLGGYMANAFTENDGIAHVRFVGVDELRAKSRSRSRSRSSSRSSERGRRRRRSEKSPARSATHANKRPKYARQGAVGFFPFRISEDIAPLVDFAYAQVFAEEKSQYETEHCMINSLRHFDLTGVDLIEVSRTCSNFALHIPRKALTQIAGLVDRSFEITHYQNSNMRLRTFTVKCAAGDEDPLPLGMLEDHIFPNVETPYSLFFLRNLPRIKTMIAAGRVTADRARSLRRFNADGTLRFGGVCVNTITALRTLQEAGHLVPLKKCLQIKNPEDDPLLGVELSDELLAKNQRIWQYRARASREASSDIEDVVEDDTKRGHGFCTHDDNAEDSYTYYAADFESWVDSTHVPCMAGAMRIETEAETVSLDPQGVTVFQGGDLVRDLFTFITDDIKAQEAKNGCKFTFKIIFFHNLRYDRTLFESHPDVQVLKVVDKNNAIYSMQVRFHGVIVSIRDSLKMIPVGISKFGSTFNLDASLRKQDNLINYVYYNEGNSVVGHRCTPVVYAASKVFDGERERDEKARDAFVTELETYLRSEQLLDAEGKFSPWALYVFYLRYDVLVLAAGLYTFRKEMNALTRNEMDVLHSLTLPSFSNRFMGHEEAFEGMYEMSGAARAYQGQAVAGGRVYVNKLFEGRHVEGKFSYLDAIGLYPSAMAYACEVLGGFPTGEALLLKPEELTREFLQGVTDYTVTVEITAIGKQQFSIPFIKVTKPDKSTDYVNSLEPGQTLVVTVDKVTLEDYIEFHLIEFTILRGLYWVGEKNPKLGQVQRELHNARDKCKQTGEKTKATIIKLVQNSAYGKLIQKSSPTDKSMIQKYKYVQGEKIEQNWTLRLYNKLHVTQSFRDVGAHQIELTHFAIDTSHTMPHIGSKILAVSKRLMNQVFNLLSDMKEHIYYTDTDSYVMDFNSVDRLAAAFAVRYGRELMGSNMMQFHSDFTFDYKGKPVPPEHVWSSEFFPMGKKLYCHQLETDFAGEIMRTLQFKCKGCTHEGLVYKAREYGEGDEGVLGLYYCLSTGESVEVPLNPPGCVRFVYDKRSGVSTNEDIYYRTIRSQAAQARVADEQLAREAELLANPPAPVTNYCCNYEFGCREALPEDHLSQQCWHNCPFRQ